MRILIIDDEPRVAGLLATAVRDQGYDVTVAHDGQDGLDRLKRERPDGVFLDLVMPGMSGLEVLRHIRTAEPTLPVIIITGHPDVPELEQARDLGVSAVIEKPGILRNLTEALAELRGRREP